MISCKEASEFSIKKADGKLSLKQRFQLWFHLAMCSVCKAFAIQSDWIDKVAGKINSRDQFTLDEKDKMQKAVFNSPDE
ncbi:hypothetical protein N8Z47_00090 [Salibacteraceae bacterium]|jgi:hypothetical protein|nr:hypothetical protein [Salibacteraceae bacterium]